ncbi:hypothetical protein AMC75_03015 [Staphylococcus carnosus]|uniref:hypothetical protein n=1 Tax=Staphylococcus carnosus TaxID=1281 RepID=UPI0006ABCC58|nr:hypothetical protein [Staphylococcus carnosus]KOR13871.1 hypothetical protein AMC75_03015 [Staphylococcus carnosus]
MSRTELKPLLNKKATVTGVIKEVVLINQLDRYSTTKSNVKILLKDVTINGIETDHLWLHEKNKYYELAEDYLHQRVKFKAKLKKYVKTRNGIIKEDIGIKRKSAIIPEETYNEEMAALYC